jgi:DNA polymerase-3 subunit alpha (Gram-positive type)
MVECIQPIPSGTFPPHLEGADKELREACERNTLRMYGDPLPDYVRERLDKELNAIIENNFAVLYVIAKKLVEYSEANGYYVGSRGSVGRRLWRLPPAYPKSIHSCPLSVQTVRI